MENFLLSYCTNTNMLQSKRDGTVTICLIKGSAYKFKIAREQEQCFNGYDVWWTLVNLKNECFVPQQYEMYSIHWAK